MISNSSENYTIGYRKYENMLKEIYDDYIKHYKVSRTFLIGFLILTVLNLLFNGWISWNEIIIRAALGTVIFALAYLLGNGFPKKKISAPFHPENYPLIIQVMKKHHRISIPKVIHLVICYFLLLTGLQVFALMDTSNIIASFRDHTWMSELRTFIVLIIFLSSVDLYRHYNFHSRLKEIEKHIKQAI